MKTRQMFMFLAAAAMLAASCQKDPLEGAVTAGQLPEGAIGFTAYTSVPVTKGTVVTKDSVQNGGMGVFAFYQAAVAEQPTPFNSRRFTTPDFMYNQKVSCSGGSWTYSPLKYWPNNVGDRVSFFGYAPYRSSQRWDDLGVSTSSNADKLYVTFNVNDDVEMQEDLLWATPQINQTDKLEGNVNDPSKTIRFTFRHITSKVQLLLGVTTGSTAEAWTDTNTVIIPKSIEFKGLNSQFKYTYTIVNDTIQEPAAVENCEGKTYDLSVKPCAAADTISSVNWAAAETAGSLFDNDYVTKYGYYWPYMETENDSSAFMFLCPQAFTDQTVSITYVVRTTDSASSQNGSSITNTITKSMADVIDTLKSGQAYRLKFLIGLDDVNFSADLVDWGSEVTDSQTDVPANFGIAVSSTSDSWTVSEIASTGSGLAREGDTLSFKVTRAGTATAFLCTPTPGTALSSANITVEPSDKSAMTAGTLYKTESGDVTTIRYIVPASNPATSIVIGDCELNIKILDDPDNKWSVTGTSCSGTGQGLAGEKLTLTIARVGTPGGTLFLLRSRTAGAEGTLDREIAYDTSTQKYTVTFTVPSPAPDSITVTDLALLTVLGVEDRWTVDSVLCSGTGGLRADDTVSFTVTASNGANGFALGGLTEDTTSPAAPEAGKYGITGTGPFTVRYTLGSDITTATTVTVADRSVYVTNDAGTYWDYTAGSAKCYKAGTSDIGLCRSGEEIRFTVAVGSSGSTGRIFYLSDGTSALSGTTYTMTWNDNHYDVVYTIEGSETFPLTLHVTDAGVKVETALADAAKWTVSGVNCSGTHSYQQGETLEFTLTPDTGYTAFKLYNGSAEITKGTGDSPGAGEYIVTGTSSPYTVRYKVPASGPSVITVKDATNELGSLGYDGDTL